MSVKTFQAKTFYAGILCAHNPDAACPLSQINSTRVCQEVKRAQREGILYCLITFVLPLLPILFSRLQNGKIRDSFLFWEGALGLKMSVELVGRAMHLDFCIRASVSVDSTALDIRGKCETKQSASYTVFLDNVWWGSFTYYHITQVNFHCFELLNLINHISMM